jgi:hypothetical protein
MIIELELELELELMLDVLVELAVVAVLMFISAGVLSALAQPPSRIASAASPAKLAAARFRLGRPSILAAPRGSCIGFIQGPTRSCYVTRDR